jgi:hypothetical protein
MPREHEGQTYYTMQEATELLPNRSGSTGVNLTWPYILAQRGELETVKIDGRLFVSEASIQTHITGYKAYAKQKYPLADAVDRVIRILTGESTKTAESRRHPPISLSTISLWVAGKRRPYVLELAQKAIAAMEADQ